MNETDKEFAVGAIIFLILCIVLGLTVKSCNKEDAILSRESHAKCFEQTKDKQCWGIK